MEKRILFNTRGYDPFIDFIKTYCILVVVFCHGFPYLKEAGYPIWGGQIPLFFLIQVFHCFKRDPKPINWRVIIKRIIVPFFVIELVIFGVIVIMGNYDSFIKVFKRGIMDGGFGPGSYYPWVYLQMAIVIPLMRPICDKLGKGKSFLVFLIFSETIEVVCSIANLPEYIYRLLFLRYIMLIWFGWMWVKEGIKLNLTTVIISLLGLCSIIKLGYFKEGLEPWFYLAGWVTHKWPCYFWISILFVWILYVLYLSLVKSDRMKHIVKVLASASYEIFLVQMAYYAILQQQHFAFIENHYLQFFVWFAFAFLVSIICGICLYKIENKYILKKVIN